MSNLIAAITPTRSLSPFYIIIDVIFLLFLAGLLVYQKKFMTLLFGLAGGILYFIVDYGIFYLALETRVVTGASTFWFLLWMSMSYGFTNFIWIWLWLARDKRLLEWSLLILAGWFCIPLIAQNFGGEATIMSTRATTEYHGAMAVMLFAGYAIVCVMNMRQKDKAKRVNLWWLLAIGILVQLGWEAMLLLGGIRPMNDSTLMTLIVNSLLETNLGIPYIFFIQRALYKRRNEDLSRVKSHAAAEGVPVFV